MSRRRSSVAREVLKKEFGEGEVDWWLRLTDILFIFAMIHVFLLVYAVICILILKADGPVLVLRAKDVL